jgi:peptidoglycan/xylan/chitin deacetylase (PgdA/CDA1 family)
MRLFRPVFFAGYLYPEAQIRIKTTKRLLYLTFDDGPEPESTPQLLDILKKHNIKALFFCVGRKAEKYPDLINDIVNAGHQIGNHSYSHLDGWQTDTGSYISDVRNAISFTSDRLFRPPYGHLNISQYRKLKKEFQIILWDVMPYDFDSSFGRERVLAVLKSRIRRGSIIVLHDTVSLCANNILEEFLIFALDEGYTFCVF